MYSNDIGYNIYQFDGKEYILLNANQSIKNMSFKHHEPYFYNKKGLRRNAAKMFYQLIINNKTYRVEIRFKGNKFTSSVQFLVHNDI